jgi:translation initiation factor 1
MGSRKKLEGGAGWSLVRACPACRRPQPDCVCGPPNRARQGDRAAAPTVRLRLEKRRGKSVTVLASSGIERSVLDEILKTLKTACACGGTLKDNELELQGEHAPRVREYLRARGIVVKG